MGPLPSVSQKSSIGWKEGCGKGDHVLGCSSFSLDLVATIQFGGRRVVTKEEFGFTFYYLSKETEIPIYEAAP